ncbi:MAG: sensor histidine kinase, partial [Actinotalea sp.]|nr:sensor histidine kinase [Actinotalea sp.]
MTPDATGQSARGTGSERGDGSRDLPDGVLDDPEAPHWRRPPIGREDQRTDYLLAAGLLIGGLLSFVLWQVAAGGEDNPPGWASLLCMIGVTAPLALRRRYPSAVGVVIAAVFIVLGSIRVPETLVANIALFLALYTIGAWEPDRRRARLARVVIVVGMFVWLIIALFAASTDPEALPELSRVGAFSPLVAFLLIQLLTNLAYFGAAYWFGDHAWSAARDRARTERKTRELEQERRKVADQAVTLERLRLARELHDAVAHHVSLMGVQASAARTLLGVDAERTAAALEQVEESAREAIGELQGILGTLREPGTMSGDHEAVGSLDVARLPELVEDAQTAGLPTTFQVIGEPTPLPPLVSLNLYRIAQEALTNARKHAGSHATADVRLRYLPDAVELEVTDDGLGARRGAPRPGSGLGLIGMRERVSADGGTVLAAPRSRGGFVVRAHVPLHGAHAPHSSNGEQRGHSEHRSADRDV